MDADSRGPTYLGIDLGTQSLKALLVSERGAVLARARAPLTTVSGLPTGCSEQHPADWLAALQTACRKLATTAPSSAFRAVAALGVSGQQHGMVPLDNDLAVIRPAKLWNDVSAAAQCQAVIDEFPGGADAWFERTGQHQLPPGFTAGKVRWLAEREPANFARLRHVLLPHDYLNLHLTGERFSEAGDASGTGVFDPRRRVFDPSAMAAIHSRSDLWPRLIEPGEVGGTLRNRVAKELGLPANIPVAAGGGDNMMAALGAGAVEPGVAVVSLGTSGTVFACTDQPVCDPEGEIAGFCASADGRWLPLGCTMNATVATELSRQLFELDLDGFEQLVATASAGADGVLCLPFFSGERSPDLPHATGAFLGLRPSNASPQNLARATVEGASFGLLRLLDRLVGLDVPVRELRLTGGGSHSATWRRIIASATDLPVQEGVDADAAALGAALQARWTVRRLGAPDLSFATMRQQLELDRELRTVDGQPEWREVYAGVRQDYQAAVDALSHWYRSPPAGVRELD